MEACDACGQAHEKCLFIVQPFKPHRPRSSRQRRPCEDSFMVNDDESIPEWEWTPRPQRGRQEHLRMISPVPSSINFPTPPPRPPSDGHFTASPDQSDYASNEGWRWQEDIQAWEDCHHVLSPMGFKCQKKNPPNPPFLVCLMSKLCGNQLQAPVAPNGGRTYSADTSTCEPEPEVALTQSMDNPFGMSPLSSFPVPNIPSPLLHPSPACTTTPLSIIIIDNMPVSPPPTPVTSPEIPPIASSPHYHN
ncbi:hypothetical protein O181_054234 [Austropuccinia psidii MF-1]|uniref:Uncharacterized protein n=1 Tax=Austropuccinia psidii MF-1 TaxID=1389203 RepID=A0A9Q3E483_9BASI|nr:hypothetical protein [Austropuccinia psidii MF-1]